MTAKRFEAHIHCGDSGEHYHDGIIDNLDKPKRIIRNYHSISVIMNNIWEQTQRFEKHNKDLADENEELKSKLGYEKRQHRHWKKECLENIKEIAQLKREIVHLKGEDGMTMKRFCISSDSNQNIYDTEEKCYYSSIDAMKLCELLNKLVEENQTLKKKLEFFYELNKPVFKTFNKEME